MLRSYFKKNPPPKSHRQFRFKNRWLSCRLPPSPIELRFLCFKRNSSRWTYLRCPSFRKRRNRHHLRNLALSYPAQHSLYSGRKYQPHDGQKSPPVILTSPRKRCRLSASQGRMAKLQLQLYSTQHSRKWAIASV